MGTQPTSVTSQPAAVSPLASASRRRSELSRVSLPSATSFPARRRRYVPIALAQVLDICARQFLVGDAADIVLAEDRGVEHNRTLVRRYRLSKPAARDQEAQRPVGAVPDADAGGGFDLERLPGNTPAHGQAAARQVGAVVAAGDVPWPAVSLPGPEARSSTRPRRRTAAASCPRCRPAAPARGSARTPACPRLGHQVQALVHAVDEVDVGVARRPEQHAGAVRHAARGVRRQVVEAEVGLQSRQCARPLLP